MSEMMDVYCHDVRKARKDHVCIECHGIISKGEFYHYHHGVFDGSGVHHKECNECCTLRGLIDKDIVYGEDLTCFEQLCDSVFNSDSLEFIRTYLETREKRRAPIPQWMKDRFDALQNAEDTIAEQEADSGLIEEQV